MDKDNTIPEDVRSQLDLEACEIYPVKDRIPYRLGFISGYSLASKVAPESSPSTAIAMTHEQAMEDDFGVPNHVKLDQQKSSPVSEPSGELVGKEEQEKLWNEIIDELFYPTAINRKNKIEQYTQQYLLIKR